MWCSDCNSITNNCNGDNADRLSRCNSYPCYTYHSGGTEQVGNDTAVTNTTTITSPTTGQEQQEEPIHIIKDGTTSYTISGSSSSIGSFDITYIIAGESSAVRASEGLIISTITSDYSSSPTIGYVMIGNNDNNTTTTVPSAGAADGGAATTLPNPFATAEQITEKITSELRRVIDEADGNNTDNSLTTLQEGGQQQPMMEIKCVFGMEIDDMRCDNYIPSAEGGTPLENGEFETDSNIS